MTHADLPAVLQLEADLFGDEAWSEAMLAAELDGAASGRYYLVAEEAAEEAGEGRGHRRQDGQRQGRPPAAPATRELVGYAGLLSPGGGQADVLTMAVVADRWGRRIGAMLLDALLAEAARRGCTDVFLEVRVDNERAQRLYRSRGFAEIGIRRGYYQPSGTDALVMQLSLSRGRRFGFSGPRRRDSRPSGRRLPMTASAGPLVLGIETSCDETGAGLVRGHELLADSVASSVAEHARFGGVVPEVASRAHLEAMVPAVDRALATAGVTLADVDAIAVTAGPGLTGALLVGVCAAKAYALALGKPLYAVNHLAAHIAVDQLEHGALPEPAIALLVSGGHSSLLLARDIAGDVQPLGATIDDAAGEAYDKVARVLGLPFPGGPPIDQEARAGDPAAIAFPRAKYRDQTLDFSFSGLKTAVARWVEERRAAGASVPVADVAASFQEAVADVLTRKAVQACRAHGVDHLVIGGGVAANSRLRALAAERCEAAGIRLRVPRPGLCTDNGAMVAALGAELVARGAKPSPLDVGADSALPVTSVLV